MKYLNRFFFALTFLTRIPVPVKIEYNKEIPAKSMLFYPVTGAIIGVITVLIDYFIFRFFPGEVRNVLVLILLIYLTGGLHLDGFIDTIDGIFSNRKPSRIIQIMHDSQVGAFGVIGLVLLMFLKFSLLLNLTGIKRISLLILMPVLSRFIMVLFIRYFPIAESSKLGTDFKKGLTWKEVTGSAGLMIIILFMLIKYTYISFFQYLIILVVSIVIALLIGYYIINKIKGITGDVLGAVNEIIEIAVLMMGLFF